MSTARIIWTAALAGALGLAAIAAAAAEDHDPGHIVELKTMYIEASMTKEPAPGSPAKLYPPGAREFGVEGHALLRCAVAPPDQFTDCEVVEEQPAGKGFGAYARVASKIVLQAVPNPRKKEHLVALLPFTFALEERKSEQDSVAAWAQRPSAVEVARAYPARAQAVEQDGWAIIGCRTAPDGRLVDCRAYDEWPHGYGFSEAALSLTGKFKIGSMKSGKPIPADGFVRIPVFFKRPG